MRQRSGQGAFPTSARCTLGQISDAIGKAGINIAELVNGSRDAIAYTLIDLDSAAPDTLVSTLRGIAGVRQVTLL